MFGISAAAVATGVATSVGTGLVMGAINGGSKSSGPSGSSGSSGSGGGATTQANTSLSPTQLAFLLNNYRNASNDADETRQSAADAGTFLRDTVQNSSRFTDGMSGNINSLVGTLMGGGSTNPAANQGYPSTGATTASTGATTNRASGEVMVGRAPDDWMAGTPYNAAAVPAGFDWQAYIGANADLGQAGIDTPEEAARHYANYGAAENRSLGQPSVASAAQTGVAASSGSGPSVQALQNDTLALQTAYENSPNYGNVNSPEYRAYAAARAVSQGALSTQQQGQFQASLQNGDFANWERANGQQVGSTLAAQFGGVQSGAGVSAGGAGGTTGRTAGGSSSSSSSSSSSTPSSSQGLGFSIGPGGGNFTAITRGDRGTAPSVNFQPGDTRGNRGTLPTDNLVVGAGRGDRGTAPTDNIVLGADRGNRGTAPVSTVNLGASRGARESLPSDQGIQGTYVDAARMFDKTGEFGGFVAEDRTAMKDQLARAIDAANRRVDIKEYNTDGVQSRSDQKYSRLSGGIDRANAIAASQGFAQALRGGLSDSTQAATTANNITREFADKYSALSEQADSSALAENQANYGSYLTGKTAEVDQNAKIAGNNTNLYSATASKATASEQNYQQAAAAAASNLLNALKMQDDAALNNKKINDDFALGTDRNAIDNQNSINKLFTDNKSIDDSFAINSDRNRIDLQGQRNKLFTDNKALDDSFSINSDRNRLEQTSIGNKLFTDNRALDDQYSTNLDRNRIDLQGVQNKLFTDTRSIDDNFNVNNNRTLLDSIKVANDFDIAKTNATTNRFSAERQANANDVTAGAAATNAGANAQRVGNDFVIGNRGADNTLLSTLTNAYTSANRDTTTGASNLYTTASGAAGTAAGTLGKASTDLAGSSWGQAGVGLVDSATGALTGAISRGVGGAIGRLTGGSGADLGNLGVDPDNAYDAAGRDQADQDALAEYTDTGDGIDWGDWSSDSTPVSSGGNMARFDWDSSGTTQQDWYDQNYGSDYDLNAVLDW